MAPGGQAAPMTYRYRGRRYVVIAAGDGGGIGTAGDYVVAFALPEGVSRRVEIGGRGTLRPALADGARGLSAWRLCSLCPSP